MLVLLLSNAWNIPEHARTEQRDEPLFIRNDVYRPLLPGDVKLPTDMRQRVANGTLFIDTVQRSADQGTYTCTARNKHNFTSHRTVEVRVLGK